MKEQHSVKFVAEKHGYTLFNSKEDFTNKYKGTVYNTPPTRFPVFIKEVINIYFQPIVYFSFIYVDDSVEVTKLIDHYTPDKPYIVGNSYKTVDGSTVTIININNESKAHVCVQGNDGIWRYNRKTDQGRVTGSSFDEPHPKNLLIPE